MGNSYDWIIDELVRRELEYREEAKKRGLGNPKFKRGDIVKFTINDEGVVGRIFVVDAYGTFGNPNEIQYDIMCEENNTLYKHICERGVTLVEEAENEN